MQPPPPAYQPGYQQQGYQQPVAGGDPDAQLKMSLTQAGLEHAGWFRRLIAAIIDGLIITIPVMIIVFALFWGAMMTAATGGMIGLGRVSIATAVLMVAFNFIYFWVMEASPWQATIGKRVMSIKVVDDSKFQRIDYKTSLLRTIGRLLWNIPTVGTLITIVDIVLVFMKNRRIGDYLAHTLVVRETQFGHGVHAWQASPQPQQGYGQPAPYPQPPQDPPQPPQYPPQ